MDLSSSDSHSGYVSFADSLTLNLIKHLEPGEYNIALKLTDGQGLSHVTTVKASVCNCDGSAKNCDRKAFLPAGIETPAILGILGGILALLSEYLCTLSPCYSQGSWAAPLKGPPAKCRASRRLDARPIPGLAWPGCHADSGQWRWPGPGFYSGLGRIALSHSWLLETFASSEILAGMFFWLSNHERKRVLLVWASMKLALSTRSICLRAVQINGHHCALVVSW